MASLQNLKIRWTLIFIFIIGLSLKTNLVSAWSDDELVQAIDSQARQLPLESFNFDAIFVQKVDPSAKISHYRPATSQEFVFSHKGDDTGKDVVVLREADDRLIVKKFKRLYIVFRRKNADSYYVTAALIRQV